MVYFCVCLFLFSKLGCLLNLKIVLINVRDDEQHVIVYLEDADYEGTYF